jgi:hypothetical protein
LTDKLFHVKALLNTAVLDGFGARKYVALERLDPGRRFVHQIVVPKLWEAIKADDPEYDPLGAPTEATGTGAVRLFVAFLECHREFERLAHPGEDVGHVMYEQGQEGCFYDDLVAALTADDPDWSPAPFDKYPRAVHPTLHRH